jgi:hypothetical protein
MAQINRVKLTQAQYARSRKERRLPGGSREAVRKAVDEERISVDAAGLIDPEVADIQWAKNTRARVSPQAVGVTDAAADLVSQAAGTAPAPSPTPTPAPSTSPSPPAQSESGYTAARARREMADAERAEIEVKKARGEYVLAEDVARAGFEIGRDLRDTMESAENGLAAEFAAANSADACASILRRHHRAVGDALVRAWREKLGQQLREVAA